MPRSDFKVIPVLDVMAGQAVHAIAGKRSHYRPIRSILHPTSEPTALARTYRDKLGLKCLYLADLDAILGGQPNLPLYRELSELGLDLSIDAGLRDGGDATTLVSLPDVTLVVGLETVRGPGAVRHIIERAGPDRVVLSLDQREDSLLLAEGAGWSSSEPMPLCRRLIALGVRRWLLLDLARVGTGRGTGTEQMFGELRGIANGVPLEISVGGGIAGIDEVAAARAAGAQGVLIGSTLHDGRITRPMIERLLDGPVPDPS
jgi:phosphoribosylformimino-5-aminoimidazole carboxamide ribotide isomerase